MKCWWATTILLIGLLAGISSADWIILKVDIKKPVVVDTKSVTKPNPNDPDAKKKSPAPEQPPGSFIYVPIEVKKKPVEDEKYRYYQMEPIGFKDLKGKDITFRLPSHQVVIDNFINTPTVLDIFMKEKYRDAKKINTPDSWIKCAKWALEHGLIDINEKTYAKGSDKFHWALEKLRELDPKNPTLAVLDKSKEEFFKNPPTTPDPRLSRSGPNGEPSLLEHFKNLKYRTYPHEVAAPSHYTLFTNLTDSPHVESDIHNRLTALEKTYLSYFYWFALHGHPLPMLKYRLGVVLTNTNTNEDRTKAKKTLVDFNPGPMAVNGFNAGRDNLLLLPSMRIDPLFQKFASENSQEWGDKAVKMTYEHLINPTEEQRVRLRKIVMFDQRKCFYLAAHQSRALAQRHMEVETERTDLTHGAARQLCIATNLTPSNVAVPEWIQYGLASFFETPPPAFYRCMAIPNWTELVYFKFLFKNELDNPGESKEKIKEILLNVVKDKYFRRAVQSAQRLADVQSAKLVLPSAKGLVELEYQKRKDTRLAHSTAWALTYYLAKTKLKLLLRYTDELNRLPRDMEFDGATLAKCFTTALEANSTSVDALAPQWFQFMKGVNLERFSPFQELLESDLRDEIAMPKTKEETPLKK